MPILHWLTREADVRQNRKAPYRFLLEDSEYSLGDDKSGNMVLQGDNLEALKALLPFYAGQVQCVYIDPPFNTKQAFPNFDDNIEHSIWLGMLQARLEFLRELLRPEGSIFIHLDDNELDYTKVIADEIFQRKNFVSRITLKARSPSAFSTVNPGVFKATEYLLWYCKDKSRMYQERIWVPREADPAYNKFIPNISKHFRKWRIEPLSPHLHEACQSVRSPSGISKAMNQFIVDNASRIVRLAEIDDDGAGHDTVEAKLISQSSPDLIHRHKREGHEDIFILNGQQLLFYAKNIRDIDGQRRPARMLTNIWDDISWEGIAKEGGVRFPRAKKPERLIRRCLQLVTRPGDLVLDSFLGSGTTAAVAHKMNRRYIGIEMGQQSLSHCVPRLRRVIEGEQSGISKLVGWKGGGGFRFCHLGPPVFGEDGCNFSEVEFSTLAAYIWFSETGQSARTIAPCGKARTKKRGVRSPVLGIQAECAVVLLYGDQLGRKWARAGSALSGAAVDMIRADVLAMYSRLVEEHPNYSLTVYAERSLLSPESLLRERITFKQIPYDIKVRA